jgi:alpha-beta hydrolase superfamily lysophospholipase
MDLTHFDHPIIQTALFHPRPDYPGYSRVPDARDGTIPVEEGVELGYRLYPYQPGAPVILYFHGNGEIASDHDSFARDYHFAGASLLVVDYRGYGWSTGTPKVSTLLGDVAPIMEALPGILAEAKLSDQKLVVMGRSLGSAPAIHAAHTYPDRFKGIIIESGFAHTFPLLARLGIPVERLAHLHDPIGNVRKMEEISLPLLVIHGENDTLIPVANGQALYDASPAAQKHLLRIAGAGHNDLMFVALDRYFRAITQFLSHCREENS